MVYRFRDFIPVVHPSSFIHPQAAVTGNVIIGRDVYIGPGAAIRGDWGQVVIEDGCNVQENCTIHMFPGVTVLLKESAHIGHGAIIHGATIGKNCLVGMNAVIMDNVQLGDECIVGALTFIKAGEIIPSRSMVVGNPHKIIKQVTSEMITWKTEGTRLYQQLPADMKKGWEACEPLTELPEDVNQIINYYKERSKWFNQPYRYDHHPISYDYRILNKAGYYVDVNTKVMILERDRDGNPLYTINFGKATPCITTKPISGTKESTKQGFESLTKREKQVLLLFSKGMSYKMVSAELKISIDSVRTYVRRMYAKLNVHSVTEAIHIAFPR